MLDRCRQTRHQTHNLASYLSSDSQSCTGAVSARAPTQARAVWTHTACWTSLDHQPPHTFSLPTFQVIEIAIAVQAPSLPEPPPRSGQSRMAPSAMHTSSVMEELRKLAQSRAKQQQAESAAAEPPERRRWGILSRGILSKSCELSCGPAVPAYVSISARNTCLMLVGSQ